jgi:proteasome assembly chaperone (PAC2) family protein
MAVRIYREPDAAEARDSIMFCGWPGIGNIGILAIDTLKGLLRAQEFGEIEPWDFFEPYEVTIEGGLLKDLEFPSNKFYFQRFNASSEHGRRDVNVLFFIGQQQPSEPRTRYAQGQKAYEMANLVLDVAEKFGCRRVYTSGAAVTQIHHTARPRVWAVPNSIRLVSEVKRYPNTILMSEIEGRGDQGVITGLNGLMLGVAKKRGLDAVCLMGEIPYYLQAAPWPYPKASKSVLEVITGILGLKADLTALEELSQKIEQQIEDFLESLYNTEAIPPEVRDEIEKLKYAEPTEIGPITDEEQKRIMEHIDELFDEGGRPDERHL